MATQTTPSSSQSVSHRNSGTLGIALMALALISAAIWFFWPDLLAMQQKWETDPHYSHGYLVPVFALVLLFVRRDQFHHASWNASWGGVVLLCCGLGLKVLSTYYYLEFLSQISLIIVLSSIPCLLWGTRGLKWALPGVAFLVFMLPLPFRLEVAMQGPLRSVGTKAGTYFLQTIGIPAFSQGHVILVDQHSIGVAEACSGLNMLMVFFALATAVALLLTESWLFRMILVASAIPIAVAANVLRISVTAAVFATCTEPGATIFGMPAVEFAHSFFHDWAGWFMMPIGLLMMWAEISILENLVVRVPDQPVSAVEIQNLGRVSGRRVKS